MEGCSGDEACGERKGDWEIIMSVCLTDCLRSCFCSWCGRWLFRASVERFASWPSDTVCRWKKFDKFTDFVRNYKPLVKLMSCVHKQVGVRLEIQTQWQKHLRSNLPFSAVSGPRLLRFVMMLQRDTYVNVMSPVSRQKKLHLDTMQRLQPTDR